MKKDLSNVLEYFKLYVDLLAVDGLRIEKLVEHKPTRYFNKVLNESGLTAIEASDKFKTGTVPFVIAKIIMNNMK